MEKLEADLYRENLKVAPLASRLLAYIIDLVILGFIMNILLSSDYKEKLDKASVALQNNYGGTYTSSDLSSNPDNVLALQELRSKMGEVVDLILISALLFRGIEVIYNFIFIYFYGATPGQLLFKLRVISSSHFSRPGLQACMGRAIAKSIFCTTLCIDFAYVFTNRLRLSLHDRLSKSIVIEA